MSIQRSRSRIANGARVALMMVVVGMTTLTLLPKSAHAQYEPPWWEVVEAESGAKQLACEMYGLCGANGGGAVTRIGVDPCFLAQNAMRPCTSNAGATKPKGVDANLAGTWELPFRNGPWVLTIDRNGTYKFRSDAGDNVPASTGSFSASDGHWSMKAEKPGFDDSGDYLFQPPNVFIATSRRGAVAWLRPDLAKPALNRCPAPKDAAPKSGDASGVSSAGVDLNVVGTWVLPIKTGGSWVWEISPNGTYKFHSEAKDNAPAHNGKFSAAKGKWSLAATSGIAGYTDSGNYLFQSPNVLMATGRLGGAAWLRPTTTSCMR